MGEVPDGVGGPQVGDRDVLAAVEQRAGHDFDGRLLPLTDSWAEDLSADRRQVGERKIGGRPVEAAEPGDDLAHPRFPRRRVGDVSGDVRFQPTLDPVDDRGEVHGGLRSAHRRSSASIGARGRNPAPLG